MYIQVTDVEYKGNYTLICTFNDGAVKNVDLSPNLDAPTFRELKDVDKFRQFGLDETIFFGPTMLILLLNGFKTMGA